MAQTRVNHVVNCGPGRIRGDCKILMGVGMHPPSTKAAVAHQLLEMVISLWVEGYLWTQRKKSAGRVIGETEP